MGELEFKEVKEKMNHLTDLCVTNHKKACESWDNGDPVKTWFDQEGNLCIEYANGKWWHYNAAGEWW